MTLAPFVDRRAVNANFPGICCDGESLRHSLDDISAKAGHSSSLVVLARALIARGASQSRRPHNARVSRRSYYPSARPARFRRASGSDRSASLALGTVDRSGFGLGISMPGA
jgi:hypothetical protein